jgi:hypothetical protein
LTEVEKFIEMYVRYRGNERLLRLSRDHGQWYAALIVPGQEDLNGETAALPVPGAALPRADLDDMTFRIEAPRGKVVGLGAGALIAHGVPVRDGWIEVPLAGICRDYHDCKDDPMPEREAAEILEFSRHNRPSRVIEPELERE